ncbi:MAG: adenosylmethionine--8-amino-7-oxononanoate transaminase [Desulfopila sp.]|jgi:adenosylmethionine-8-amino-7-oxononanoate aminotransferase|nr:adenosylmethionine--8-amino-7-oxononanoate transaminase [Desulfopila sp.]
MDRILEFDQKHLWHPYTSIEAPLPVYEVVSADGVRLRLRDGREIIDGMSSWWAVIHGYNHPVLIEALKKQADSLCHVMFGGITHEPAVALGRLLVDMTPVGLERVFLCDSGSVAVEVAMKMALQYYYALGKNNKNRFLTIKSGYHGDTFHAMSVCDPITGMHQIYHGVLPQYYFAERPEVGYYDSWNEDDISSLRRCMETRHRELCGVILEPTVQGAGGMRFYHPEYLRRVRQLCDHYDVLFIADEIATGFGRSGELFGCDHAGVVPDIMCLGKALTGGYMTLAAVVTTDLVGKGISSGAPHVFMHGPTFMANPLACSVAAASLGLLKQGMWRREVKELEKSMKKGLEPCLQMDHVIDVRVLGAIGVVELAAPIDMAVIQKKFVDHGVWVRPFGRLVYLMPPYCMSSEDIDTLTEAVVKVVATEGKL